VAERSRAGFPRKYRAGNHNFASPDPRTYVTASNLSNPRTRQLSRFSAGAEPLITHRAERSISERSSLSGARLPLRQKEYPERKRERERERERERGGGTEREEEEGLSSRFGFPPSRNCEDDPGGRRTNVCGRTILYVRCPTFPLRLSVALPLFLRNSLRPCAAVSPRARGTRETYPSAASRAPLPPPTKVVGAMGASSRGRLATRRSASSSLSPLPPG